MHIVYCINRFVSANSFAFTGYLCNIMNHKQYKMQMSFYKLYNFVKMYFLDIFVMLPTFVSLYGFVCADVL